MQRTGDADVVVAVVVVADVVVADVVVVVVAADGDGDAAKR